MAGVHINYTNPDGSFKPGVAYTQPLRNFNASINSQEDFVSFGYYDGSNKLIPIPCYKTNRVTIDGERVYYPAMSLADAKAFKALRNKSFLTRADKSLMVRVSEALDKCAVSYGLSAGSIPLNRLSDYYEHFERSGGGEDRIPLIRAVSTGSNT